MADAPELLLRRTLAGLLDSWDLAVYAPGATLPARGIRTDGVVPTNQHDCTVLKSPPTSFDGRADALYRVQFWTRRLGGPLLVEKWASDLNDRLDHAEYTPRMLGISWTEEVSRLYFDADSSGRVAVACTYSFRGRRAALNP